MNVKNCKGCRYLMDYCSGFPCYANPVCMLERNSPVRGYPIVTFMKRCLKSITDDK